MADRKFAHLHLHTHYSLLDGANRIPELVAQTKKLGMTACAITDHGNLYGAIEFYKECKAAGVNPVIGYEAYLAPGDRREKKAARQGEAYTHLTLLAKNNTGFKNLIKLSSIAFLEGFYYNPRIDREILATHSEGLIALSGCLAGEFNQHILKNRADEAEKLAKWFHRLFKDDFYIEIQNNGIGLQDLCTPVAADIADKLGVPLVATADAHYLCADDAEAHDVLFCINTGKKRDPRKKSYPEEKMPNPYFVRSPEDMYRLFPDYGDAVARSQEIADQVHVELDFKQRYFPVFHTPAGKSDPDYLRELCEEALKVRYKEEDWPRAQKRLDHELGIIARMGFASYFLIVWDFVRFAREEGIPCQARGSGCGAIVCYLLYLSHVDPLDYDLLFERFLDPNRSEAPDIDIDFCQDRRELVIQYVKKKYGSESVAQIGTFGTLAAKAALKDVGRVLDIPLDRVNFMCKLVPMKGAITLSLKDALKDSPDFKREYETDPTVKQWVDIARKLEGMNRGVGTHAAGVVIANGPITDYVPVQRATRKGDDGEKTNGETTVTTQWEMGDIEKVGLLKMDFLGLRTLTLIDNTLKLIKKTRAGKPPREGLPLDVSQTLDDVQKLPLDDAKTYQLLQKGDAKGVFQFESEGIRDLLKRMKPDNIRDIVACTALYRPGPLEGGMVDEYIECKHGRKQPYYPHAIMQEVLSETYGVMVYQEQVMRMLNRMGGIELSSAYACIKAISKKKQDIIDARKIDFIKGAQDQGMAAEKAEEIFEQIVKFGGYGFNKCVVAGTRVSDAVTGEVTTVGELFLNQRPFVIHAKNDEGRLVPRPVTAVMWNGRKPVFRLTTASGRQITATTNHPFWTPWGWIHLGDLRPGDAVGAAETAAFVTPKGCPTVARGGAQRNPWSARDPHPVAPTGRPSSQIGSPRWGYHHMGSLFQGFRCAPPLATVGHPFGVTEAGPATTTRLALWDDTLPCSNLFWDRVVSVEPAGVEDTYDLTVDVDHNFVADGLIVHNSHSAAYAHVTYHTAYLKTYYPAEFMAALLSSEIDDGNKRDMLVDHIADARKLGVDVLPPDVNKGQPDFDVVDGRIVFGLTAIKGLGRGAATEIVRAREAGGRFKDLFDFCERVDPRSVSKAAVEKMIKAGAMDCFGKGKRQAMFHALPRAAAAAEEIIADRKRGQKNIFDMFGDGDPSESGTVALLAKHEPLPDMEEWPELERLKFEKEALDFYISSHPLAQFDEQLRRYRSHDTGAIAKLNAGTPVSVAGMVTELIPKVVTKGRNQGNRWAIVRVEDFTGSVKCILWSDQYARFKDEVVADAILLFEGKVEWREGSTEPDLIVDRVMTPDQARKEMTKGMVIRVAYTDDPAELRKFDGVAGVLRRSKGGCPVYLSVKDPAGKVAAFKLNSDFWVDPTAVKVDELELLLGPGCVLFTGR